jgi:hypothetical protein
MQVVRNQQEAVVVGIGFQRELERGRWHALEATFGHHSTGVDEISLSPIQGRAGHREVGRAEQIVVVEERNIVALGVLDAYVAGTRGPDAMFEIHDLDGQRLRPLSYDRIDGAPRVVDDDHVQPSRRVLGRDARKRLAQELRPIQGGQDDAHRWQ